MTSQELAELIRGKIKWEWQPGDYAIFKGVAIEIAWTVEIVRIDGKLLYYLPVYKDSIGEQGDAVDDMYDVAENLTPDLLNERMLSRVLRAIEAKGYNADVETSADESKRFVILFKPPSVLDHEEEAPTLIEAAVRALLHVYGIEEG